MEVRVFSTAPVTLEVTNKKLPQGGFFVFSGWTSETFGASPIRKRVIVPLVMFLGVAAATVFLAPMIWIDKSVYPDRLLKYVKIIEDNPGGGFSSFRIDVSEQVCIDLDKRDFDGLAGQHGDVDVRVHPYEISIQVIRPLHDFHRVLLLRWGEQTCEAFVESYYL